MSELVLFACRLNPAGGVSPLDAAEAMTGKDPAWIHLDSNHEDARGWLEKHLELDGHHLDALLDNETRPRALRDGDRALILLRGVNLNAGSEPEDMVTLRIFADAQRIVTLRGRQLKAASDLEAQLQRETKPVTTGDVLCRLLDCLLNRMSPVLEALDDGLDMAEEKIIEEANSSMRKDINNIRRQAILFRRYIAPQREAIYQIKHLGFDWLNQDQQEHLVESHNLVQRFLEDLDAIRERAQIVKDELANILSERMNKNTFVLTIVAAVFLPISFLTGLLGINVGGIPGADYGNAFWVFCGILALVVILQIVLFKRMKWF
jgi:zinc transporter